MISVRSEMKLERRTLAAWSVADAEVPLTMPIMPSDTHWGPTETNTPTTDSANMEKSTSSLSSPRVQLSARSNDNNGRVTRCFFHADSEMKVEDRLDAMECVDATAPLALRRCAWSYGK